MVRAAEGEKEIEREREREKRGGERGSVFNCSTVFIRKDTPFHIDFFLDFCSFVLSFLLSFCSILGS